MNKIILIYSIICWAICTIHIVRSAIKDKHRDPDWALLIVMAPIISIPTFLLLPFFTVMGIFVGLSYLIERINE